jgi:hypothetical protein
MHNLEQLVAEWRKTMLTRHKIHHGALDELENHLRESVEQLLRSGMTEPEAFGRAVTELGAAPAIASEFQKLQRPWWPIKLVAGLGIVAALAFAILSSVGFAFDSRPTSLLLAAHVFTVGLGYTTTLLVGALGICFVGQRCFSDLSPLRLHSVTRVSFVFGCVAAGLTAVGVILGMLWAKAEWGRYWAWDIRESGAFAVVLWQVFFLFMHRSANRNARGILITSLLGNIVVSLGWFGANLASRPQNDWTLHYSLFLLAVVVFNLMFFIAGLAPAGWLRLHKAS